MSPAATLVERSTRYLMLVGLPGGRRRGVAYSIGFKLPDTTPALYRAVPEAAWQAVSAYELVCRSGYGLRCRSVPASHGLCSP
jgi:hypothetical protein